jgi:hypothetical protein
MNTIAEPAPLLACRRSFENKLSKITISPKGTHPNYSAKY